MPVISVDALANYRLDLEKTQQPEKALAAGATRSSTPHARLISQSILPTPYGEFDISVYLWAN